jgi:DNA-binding CsgD family transcriptional regulator
MSHFRRLSAFSLYPPFSVISGNRKSSSRPAFKYSKISVNTVNLPATSALNCGRPLLGQPDFILSFLVEKLSEEFVFYSLDSNWRFVYLSSSAKSALGMEPSEWMGRPLWEALSGDDCNTQIRNMAMSLSPMLESIKGTCEFAPNGNPARKLAYRHARILHNLEPIGYAGIAYSPSKFDDGVDWDALLAKVNSLSPVERQVIEFVFQGRQNKSIAAELNVAVRTIESRRARAMAKLEVSTLAEMVKLWAQVQNIPKNLPSKT